MLELELEVVAKVTNKYTSHKRMNEFEMLHQYVKKHITLKSSTQLEKKNPKLSTLSTLRTKFNDCKSVFVPNLSRFKLIKRLCTDRQNY